MLGLGLGLNKNTNKRQIVRNGLVLYLDGRDFKNSPPTSLWMDRSGLGNNATPSGFAYTTASGSDGVGGVVFDGVNDRCVTPVIDYKLSKQLTIDVNISNIPKDKPAQVIFENGTSFNGYTGGFILSYENNSLTMAIQATTGYILNHSAVIDLSVSKNNLTARFDTTQVNILDVTQLYINGIKQTMVNTTTNVGRDFAISNKQGYIFNRNLSSLFASAKLHNLRVYNRALTDTEILQNYNASR